MIRDLGTLQCVDVCVVSKFAAASIKPKAAEMDRAASMDRGIIKQLFERGIMGIEIPAENGGSGLSFTAAIIAVEGALSKNTLVNTMFIQHASARMKEKYLPLLANNRVTWASWMYCIVQLGSFCLSEASSGSDAFALKMTARKDGDHHVLNGTKMWITNSHEAEIFVVFATIDPSAGYRGITSFVVERSDAGLSIGKKEDKLGIRASSTCTVSFDNLRIPSDRVLGDPGRGYKYAIEILNEGRIGIAAQMLGLAQGAFDIALPYMFQRKQFNALIGDFQGIQHQYAQIATEIEAVRLLTYNASRLKESGSSFVKEAAMAKLLASQVAERASSKCIEWMGGVGITREVGVEKLFRDCKIGAIYEGTSNIQLQTIAKLIAKDYAVRS